jgi:hypothetical protein
MGVSGGGSFPLSGERRGRFTFDAQLEMSLYDLNRHINVQALPRYHGGQQLNLLAGENAND